MIYHPIYLCGVDGNDQGSDITFDQSFLKLIEAINVITVFDFYIPLNKRLYVLKYNGFAIGKILRKGL